MDKFKKGVGYLGYAQQDPINVYTNKGFEMFQTMTNTIGLEVAMYTLNLKFVVEKKAPVNNNVIETQESETSNV